jgi:hypothetical protein
MENLFGREIYSNGKSIRTENLFEWKIYSDGKNDSDGKMITVGTPGLGVRHPHGVLSIFVRMDFRERGPIRAIRHPGGGRPDRASRQ